MIKYYYKSLRSEGLLEVESFKPGIWVYVEMPSEKELAELADKFDLELGLLEDALDEDEVSRYEKEGDASYFFVRFPYQRSPEEVDTSPVLVIYTSDAILTVCRTHLPALDYLQRGRTQYTTTQRTKLILLILSHISDQYEGFVNQTSRRLKETRNRLRGHAITDQDLVDFVSIEDELNEFLSALQPNNATLRRLLASKHIRLFDEDQDIVEDLLLSNQQSIDTSAANIKSISNIRDAYSAIASNKLNRTLTILTIATILISIPSLAMGVYSLNLPLPAQHSGDTFWVIMAINITLMGVVLLVARKKRLI